LWVGEIKIDGNGLRAGSEKFFDGPSERGSWPWPSTDPLKGTIVNVDHDDVR
jgi:hypothetical protein